MSKRPEMPHSRERYHPWSTYIVAREEARRRGDRRVGTEHLLVALLENPVLAGAVGSDAERARSALETMDSQALVMIGMDEPPVVAPLPAGDPRELPARPSFRTVLHKRLRLTPCAAKVLRESSRGMRRGTPHPGPEHVLAEILELQRPDPAAELLATLGARPDTIRESLADV
jgi:hypothetical protein